MKRSALGSLALLVVLATLVAGPASAQEGYEGFFEGQQSIGGQIGGGNGATGAIVLRGWALAASGVAQVVIQVDGRDDGNALLGRRRPDVERLFPNFPDSPAAGFGYRLNTTRYQNGLHTVSAKLITNSGNTFILDGTRDFLFNNNTTILVPFGNITAPERNAQLFGTCDPNATRRRLVPIEGWALDLGILDGDTGIGWLELMIDGQPPSLAFDTRVGCRFIFDAGGFTNCYGLPRPEIERLYPFAINAPNAGFRFAVDIGALISLGYSEGNHLITIRANDNSNQLADIADMPVVFRCIEGVPNEGAFGQIESPRVGVHYAGNLLIQGWLLDAEGVDRVRIDIDGERVGFAAYGVEDGIFDTRPSVFSQYPGFPNVDAPVFRLIGGFDTTQLSDGGHQLQVYVVDREGDVTLIGEVSFFVDNRDDG